MQDSMQVYRFTNGNGLMIMATANEENAKQLAFEQATAEAPLVLIDQCNDPKIIEMVMMAYQGNTIH